MKGCCLRARSMPVSVASAVQAELKHLFQRPTLQAPSNPLNSSWRLTDGGKPVQSDSRRRREKSNSSATAAAAHVAGRFSEWRGTETRYFVMGKRERETVLRFTAGPERWPRLHLPGLCAVDRSSCLENLPPNPRAPRTTPGQAVQRRHSGNSRPPKHAALPVFGRARAHGGPGCTWVLISGGGDEDDGSQ